jgi:hypothetical protein
MNQKGYINIILVVLVVIFAGVVGYLTLIKKPTPPATTNTPTQQTPSTTSPEQKSKIEPTPSLPTTCKDEPEGVPVITSLSIYSGPVGTKLEIRGCNFAGFEGDINAWIENNEGEKGFLQGEAGSTSKIIKVTLKSSLCRKDTSHSGLPCDEWLTLTPGTYKIYTMPWGKKSNEVTFTILESTPKPVNWENLIPTIRTVLGPTFLGVRVEQFEPLSIFQEKDITGDGVPEALVYLGNGGAYTFYLTLMRIEDDKPVVAQFKQKDGKISPLMFLDGASVMNGESTVMLPDKKAIYTGHWSRAVSGTSSLSLANCSVEAYQWNSQTRNFDFSLSLSNEIKPGFCQGVEKVKE